jgi:hypothetical protein
MPAGKMKTHKKRTWKDSILTTTNRRLWRYREEKKSSLLKVAGFRWSYSLVEAKAGQLSVTGKAPCTSSYAALRELP